MSLFDRVTKLIPRALLRKIDETLERVIYQSGAGRPFQELRQQVHDLEHSTGTRLMLEYFETRLDNLYANLLKTPAFGPPPAPAASPLPAELLRLEATLRLLASLSLPPHKKVLIDLGCAAPLLPMVRRVLPGHELVCVSALEQDRLPLEDGSANVVLLLEVIEHLYRDPLLLLAEIKRVLVPGGVVVISHGSHVHEYVVRDLARLLDEGGFESRCFTENDTIFAVGTKRGS